MLEKLHERACKNHYRKFEPKSGLLRKNNKIIVQIIKEELWILEGKEETIFLIVFLAYFLINLFKFHL